MTPDERIGADVITRASGGAMRAGRERVDGRSPESVDAQVRLLSALRRLLTDGVGALTVPEAAGVLARIVREELGTQHAVAYLADEDGRIGQAVMNGVDPAMRQTLTALLQGVDGEQVPLWRRRLQGEEHPVLAVDDARRSDLVPLQVVEAIALRSYIAFPVLGGEGEVLGGIVCSHSDRTRTWTDEERDLVRQLALEGSMIVENAYLREANERRLAELVEQARSDPLTGLANRTRLFERLDLAIAARPTGTIGIVFVDVDQFKAVNDTHGHGTGDQVLLTVADTLRSCIRGEDTACRFAGDEFVVLLDEATRDETLAVARRIADRLTDLPVAVPADHTLDGRPVHLRVSAAVGVAASAPPHTSSEALVRRADQAMYRAKRTGEFVAAYHPSTDGTVEGTPVAERPLASAPEWGRRAAAVDGHADGARTVTPARRRDDPA